MIKTVYGVLLHDKRCFKKGTLFKFKRVGRMLNIWEVQSNGDSYGCGFDWVDTEYTAKESHLHEGDFRLLDETNKLFRLLFE